MRESGAALEYTAVGQAPQAGGQDYTKGLRPLKPRRKSLYAYCAHIVQVATWTSNFQPGSYLDGKVQPGSYQDTRWARPVSYLAGTSSTSFCYAS